MFQKFKIVNVKNIMEEKFLKIMNIENSILLKTSFLNGDYLENIKVGDIKNGNLKIWLGHSLKKVNDSCKLYFVQPLEDSPHIELIVEVITIIDKYEFYVFSILQKEKLLIEIEEDIDIKIGDKIYLEGELTLMED